VKTPETDDLARGNHVVPTEWAEQLERERDEARQQNAKLRAVAERAIEDIAPFNGMKALKLIFELEELKEASK
jgi:LPS sulfotransferase NodH